MHRSNFRPTTAREPVSATHKAVMDRVHSSQQVLQTLQEQMDTLCEKVCPLEPAIETVNGAVQSVAGSQNETKSAIIALYQQIQPIKEQIEAEKRLLKAEIADITQQMALLHDSLAGAMQEQHNYTCNKLDGLAEWHAQAMQESSKTLYEGQEESLEPIKKGLEAVLSEHKELKAKKYPKSPDISPALKAVLKRLEAIENSQVTAVDHVNRMEKAFSGALMNLSDTVEKLVASDSPYRRPQEKSRDPEVAKALKALNNTLTKQKFRFIRNSDNELVEVETI